MKNIAMIAVLALAGAASAHAADAGAGKELTTMCAACHGADGNSAAATFPKLAGQGEKYLIKQMKDIRDGARNVPTMAGQLDGKSDEDLANIAAFYASQAKSGGQVDPELLELGQSIYRGGISDRKVPACQACHSPHGKGNAPAGFPSLAGQHADYTEAQLRAYREGYQQESGRTNDGETMIMRTVAFPLSDLEIKAVSSYIAGLK